MFVCLFVSLFCCVLGVESRIAGGLSVSSSSAAPFQCALVDAVSRRLVCGCSLVSRSWLLSAAACVRTVAAASDADRSVSSLVAVFGGAALGQAARAVQLLSIAVHPSYTFAVSENSRVNLAWMQLAGPAVPSYTADIRPVVLASPADAALLAVPGTVGAVVGWGQLASGEFPSQLHAMSARLSAPAACNALLGASGRLPVNTATELCAGQNGTNVCSGDTGGALVVASTSGVTRQIGVVSRSTANACDGTGLGIYTQVAPYRDYIQSYINEPLYTGTGVALSFCKCLLALVVIVLAF